MSSTRNYGVFPGCSALATHLFTHPSLPDVLLYPLEDDAAYDSANGVAVLDSPGFPHIIAYIGRDKQYALSATGAKQNLATGTENRVIGPAVGSRTDYEGTIAPLFATQPSLIATPDVASHGFVDRQLMGVVSSAHFGVVRAASWTHPGAHTFPSHSSLVAGYMGSLVDIGFVADILASPTVRATFEDCPEQMREAITASLLEVIAEERAAKHRLFVPVGVTWRRPNVWNTTSDDMVLKGGLLTYLPAVHEWAATLNQFHSSLPGGTDTGLRPSTVVEIPSEDAPAGTNGVSVITFDPASSPAMAAVIAAMVPLRSVSVDGVMDIAAYTTHVHDGDSRTFAQAVGELVDVTSTRPLNDATLAQVTPSVNFATPASAFSWQPSMTDVVAGGLTENAHRMFGTVPRLQKVITSVYDRARQRLS